MVFIIVYRNVVLWWQKFVKVDVFLTESEEDFLLSGVVFRFALVLDNAIKFLFVSNILWYSVWSIYSMLMVPVHGDDVGAQQQGGARTAYHKLLIFQEDFRKIQSCLISASFLKYWMSMQKK